MSPCGVLRGSHVKRLRDCVIAGEGVLALLHSLAHIVCKSVRWGHSKCGSPVRVPSLRPVVALSHFRLLTTHSTLHQPLLTHPLQLCFFPPLHHLKHSALMETLKHTNNNQPSSLGASIGAALSGAPGTDGAHLLLSDSSRLPAAELPAPMSEKPLSATTLDRKARWWP
ncbi:hypothetical protein PCASD_10571 [Puccinia coronata f. sp. avenae]|uniref:Uncharacterized protein n=1 Tax=Puccinia coronata f. sp. avenae TaxID=200324 RepID=A0A2N5UKR0_9BASI|nr:hypothetical protein PCASD_10571 [Puccinia coronata f. sp. avenae]